MGEKINEEIKKPEKKKLTDEERAKTYILNRKEKRKVKTSRFSTSVMLNGERQNKVHGDINRKSNHKYMASLGMKRKKEDTNKTK
jgi:hypothetical protein